MGLSAVVYKGTGKLRPGMDTGRIQVDDTTGEITLADGSAAFEDGTAKAASCHLGNLTQIGYLRQVVLDRFPNLQSSIIITKILYSGSHSGDAISMEEVGSLKKEVDLIAKGNREYGVPELDQFLKNLEDLIRVAHLEGNPISFV